MDIADGKSVSIVKQQQCVAVAGRSLFKAGLKIELKCESNSSQVRGLASRALKVKWNDASQFIFPLLAGVGVSRVQRGGEEVYCPRGCPTLSNTVQHCPTLSKTYPTLSNSVQHCPTLSNTLQDYPTLSNTVQHSPTLSNTLQHCPTLSNTVQDMSRTCPGLSTRSWTVAIPLSSVDWLAKCKKGHTRDVGASETV